MKRKHLGVLLLVAAINGLFGFAVAPASAYCDPVWTELTGQCSNGCTVTSAAYYRATGQHAPWECPM